MFATRGPSHLTGVIRNSTRHLSTGPASTSAARKPRPVNSRARPLARALPATMPTKPVQSVSITKSSEPLPAVPATASSARPARTVDWPWRSVDEPTFPLPEGLIEEQRTVYARDPPFRPRMFWFVAGAIFVGSLLTAEIMRGHPDLRGPHGELILPEGAYDDGVLREPLRSIPERIQQAMPGVPVWIIRQYLAGGIVVIGGFACAFILVRPAHGAGPEKTFVKMTHAGHVLLPKRVTQYRVIDPASLVVSRIAKGRVTQSVLKANILGGPNNLFSFDRYSYRLPFQRKLHEVDPEAEVVVSLRRLEEVFGEIE